MLSTYAKFLEQLKRLDLLEACSLKPLLDGKSLSKALGIAPGPWMKSALDVVMAWQLRHPDRTDALEAIEEVKNKKGELTKSLAAHFLKLTIRPLFAKTQLPEVTALGRKATTSNLPRKYPSVQLDDTETKSWKGHDAYALDLLQWVPARPGCGIAREKLAVAHTAVADNDRRFLPSYEGQRLQLFVVVA